MFINQLLAIANDNLVPHGLQPVTERTVRFWLSSGQIDRPEKQGRNLCFAQKHVDAIVALRLAQRDHEQAVNADKALTIPFAIKPIEEIAEGAQYIIPHVEFRVVAETKAEYGKVKGPEQVADLIRKLTDGLTDERFYSVCLDNRNHVVAIHLCSIGDHAATLVHPRSVFRTAVYSSAVAIVVAHNHPSGDCEPSGEDIAVTRRLHEAGKTLGIPMLDHVIIGGQAHKSMRQLGYL